MKTTSPGPTNREVLLANIGGTTRASRFWLTERYILQAIPAQRILDDVVAFVGLRTLMEVAGIG